jgi:uncharacterized membrane protein
MTKMTVAALTTALAGAAALAATAPAPVHAEELLGFVRCYGISKAGQNSCASSAGSHSCAGQADSDYSGHEWRATKADICARRGGKTQAFDGTGSPAG